jgi:hypothetical protein
LSDTIPLENVPKVDLTETLRDYNLIGVGDDYIVVEQRPQKLAEPSVLDFAELGTSGVTVYGQYSTDDYNPELRGLLGIKKYDQMRRGDAQVKASLMLLKAPVLGARWFMEPASDSVRDKNAAEFIWKCFTEYMSVSWTQVLTEALLMLDFGYYLFEKVYDIRVIDGAPRIVWKKFAPRHPLNVVEWKFDRSGGPESIEFGAPEGVQHVQSVNIPIDKLVVFTHQREAGNIMGVSALRSAYKHWYFKENLYKIDAIQKERHGIGIPIIKLPPNPSPKDISLADQIGRNLRVNEKAHVVLLPGWEIDWADLKGQPVDCITSVEHHNRMILVNVLGQLVDRQITGGGDQLDHDMYLHAASFVADTIRDVFNLYCIPQLMGYNFERVGIPKLNYWFVPNLRDLSFTLRNLVGADLMRPTQEIEDLLRELGHLPAYDKGSDRVLELRRYQEKQAEKQARVALAPGQLPNARDNRAKADGARPGLPRQAPSPPVGPGRPNSGSASNNSA